MWMLNLNQVTTLPKPVVFINDSFVLPMTTSKRLFYQSVLRLTDIEGEVVQSKSSTERIPRPAAEAQC